MDTKDPTVATPLLDDHRPLLCDPVAFAEHLHDELVQATEADRFLRFDPPSFARYVAAVERVRSLHADGLDVTHPVELLDEAARDWANRAHAAGVKLGVEAEALRRELLGMAEEKTAS